MLEVSGPGPFVLLCHLQMTVMEGLTNKVTIANNCINRANSLVFFLRHLSNISV